MRESTSTARRAAWEALGDVRRSLRTLLAADAFVKLLAAGLLAPLLGVALRGFVSFSGSSVLTDQDILFFVLSPFGALTLIAITAGALCIVAIELSCLMAVTHAERLGRPIRAAEALALAARKAIPILRLAGRVVSRVLLLAAPFLVVAGLTYLALLGEHDINYYLALRPPEFQTALAVGGLLLAALAVVLGPRLVSWSQALPLVLFEDVAPARALGLSRDRTRGEKRTVTLALLWWLVGSTLVATVVLGVFGAAAGFLVSSTPQAMALLLPVMGSLFLVGNALSVAVTFLQSSWLAALVVGLFLGPVTARGEVPSSGRPARSLAPAPRRTLLLALAVGALVSLVVGWLLLGGVRVDDDVLVIAHRGAAGRAPENTLASVRAAIEDGADLVEIDVQETSDGEVVVLHDSDFMKIGGDPRKIWDLTLAEARTIDIGSWFDPAYRDERAPLLAEVLDACRGKARVDIELKYYGHDERLEERVIEIVEAAGMADDVVVMSLKIPAVEKMRELRPGWTVGVLAATAVGNLTALDVDFLAVHSAMATSAFVRRAHAAGKDVYVWTVNDPVHMSRLATRGVDGLITDEPALARRVLAQRAEMSSLQRLLLEAAFWLGAVPSEPSAQEDL